MSIYKVDCFNAAGDLLKTRNAQGSCTGCFQFGNSVYMMDDCHRYDVQFTSQSTQSRGFWDAIVGSKLIQALTPGAKVIDHSTNPQRVTISFFNVNELPGDQTVTAMRIIKGFGCGYYSESLKTLREYELTADELVVLAAFTDGNAMCKGSDSVALLAWQTKADAVEIQGNNRYVVVGDSQKEWPTAGMLLPLIRGEIKPGKQWPVTKGYFKEGALRDNLTGENNYDSMEVFHMYGPEDCLTINHPLLWYENEHQVGPTLDNTRSHASNQQQAVEWVLEKLGK